MFTVCKHCLRTVPVKADGTIGYHIHSTWDKDACPGFKEPATWTEQVSLTAHGRNPRGACMACGGQPGEIRECSQCNYEVYKDDNRRIADYKRRKAK